MRPLRPVRPMQAGPPGAFAMKITRIRAYQVDLPLHEGSYKWSGGKSVTVFDSTVVQVETDAGADAATARSARSGRSTCRPTPTACAPASRSWGRTCSAKTRCQLPEAEPPHGRRPQGARLRQVGHRHGLLGHPRQGDGAAGLHAAGRPLRRRLRPLSRHLAGVARGDGEPRRRLPGRGLSPLPAQGRRRSRRGHRAHSRRRRAAASRATA